MPSLNKDRFKNKTTFILHMVEVIYHEFDTPINV